MKVNWYIAALLGLMCGIADASGADIPGATCVPDFPTLNTPLVTTTGGVSVANGNFYCGIPNASQMSPPTQFSLLFAPDSGAGHKMIATYYKMNKTTGALTAISNIDTSTCFQNFGLPKTCFAYFTDTFDPSTYTYFVAVTFLGGGIFYAAMVD